MIHTLFNYISMFYYAFNESLFLKIFGILIFRAAAYYIYNPKENWYYPQDYKEDINA